MSRETASAVFRAQREPKPRPSGRRGVTLRVSGQNGFLAEAAVILMGLLLALGVAAAIAAGVVAAAGLRAAAWAAEAVVRRSRRLARRYAAWRAGYVRI